MNLLALINECIEDLELKRKPLSHINMKCQRIAYFICDLEAWLWLKMDSISTNDKRINSNLREECKSFFIEKGYKEEFNRIYQEYIEDYLLVRQYTKIDIVKKEAKDMIIATSIGEIEASIENIELRLSKNEIPTGLHSLDLYYADKEKQNIDFVLMSDLGGYKKVLSRISTKMYEFLVKSERKYLMSQNNNKNNIENNNKVFIIHGHDEAKWRELEKILKEDFKLQPYILNELPDNGKTLVEKFEYYGNQCCYAFAIFTPDDIIENNGTKYFQARPNVIFELGWFCSHLGRDRVCILFKEGNNTSIFSDFQGVIQKRFINSITEVYRDIKLELNSIGIY